MFATLAAIGTADTPAAPIRGLTLFLLNIFITLATRMPDAVPMANATIPSNRIPKVSGVKNLSAASFDPTDKPRKIVTIFINDKIVFDKVVHFPKRGTPRIKYGIYRPGNLQGNVTSQILYSKIKVNSKK